MLFDPRWRFSCLLRRPLIKTSIYYINFSSNSAFGGKRPYLKEALDYTRLRTIGARALVSVEKTENVGRSTAVAHTGY